MSTSAAATHRAPRIGFVTQVDHTGIHAEGAAVTSSGMEEGIELFLTAEDLGYDTGYVRVRHLQDALSSPLLFLAAVGQRTRRIQLGTAVIPLRFENAGRLAEDLASADLLTGGRLRPGISSGYSAHDAMYARAFGALRDGRADHVDRVLHDLVSLLDGEIVAGADSHIEGVDPGAPLRMQPRVPSLRNRLAYGAAGPQRAEMAGQLGLQLQLATMVPDDGSGRSFEELPVRSDAELERYVTLLPRERTADPRIVGEHHGQEIGGHDAVFSEVVLDEPAAVARKLWEDPVVQAADELALALPPGAPLVDQQSLLSTFARLVIPQLQMVLGRRGARPDRT